MKDATNPVAEGMDRFTALLGWWGILGDGSGNIDSHVKRMLQFGAELQAVCGEAYSSQTDAFITVNDRLTRSLQDLMHSRRPQDVAAAESDMVAAMFEGASTQAKRWVDLAQKLQDCSAAIARSTAADLRGGDTQSASASAGNTRHAATGPSPSR